MKNQHHSITYKIINPNANDDVKNVLKQMIIEKLLMIHRGKTITTN